MGSAVLQWDEALQYKRKVTGEVPDGVVVFHLPKSLTEISARGVSWGGVKAVGAYGRFSRSSGSLKHGSLRFCPSLYWDTVIFNFNLRHFHPSRSCVAAQINRSQTDSCHQPWLTEPSSYGIQYRTTKGRAKFLLLMCILHNQRDATYTMFFTIISALHVSGGFSSHHQELIKLYVQPWVLSCFPAVYRWCGWIGTVELKLNSSNM